MNLNEQLDKIKNYTFPKRDMIYICDTPKLLKEIGLEDLPIMMTQKHLYTVTNKEGKYKDVNYHNLPFSIIENIPEQLNNPLKILQSNTKEDSIVVVSDLKDNDDKPIVIVIKRNGIGEVNNIRIKSNILTSLYGKDNIANIIHNNLIYSKEKGIIKRVSRDRLQLPMRTNSSIDSISKSDKSVNKYYVSNNKNNTIKEVMSTYDYYILEII